MINIIFDLDGTLIDSKLRLYNLFQYLVPASNLSYNDYWAFKKNKFSNEFILINEFSFDEDKVKCFLINWMKYIETPEFLAYDQKLTRVNETLDRLSKQYALHVCTARQYRQSVIDQLKRLHLLSYFNSVMVTEQRKSKSELIAASVSGLTSRDWIIGDTGNDIQAGNNLGIKTCGVLSGFLSEKSLLLYKPDLIIQSIDDFHVY